MMHIINKHMEGNILKGEILLPGKAHPVPVSFDPDPDEEGGGGSPEAIVRLAETCISALPPEYESGLRNEVSIEITDAAYSQDDAQSAQEDYDRLRDDLILEHIAFFPEDMVWTYLSPAIFPGNEISVQLTYDLEIIEVMVLD